jgi:membrane protease YdiL (CAAX protease family)
MWRLKKRLSFSVPVQTFVVFAGICLAWTLTWILKEHLDANFSVLASASGSFVFWTTAKLILWILPAFWLVRVSERTLGETFNLGEWRRWLVWGAGTGIVVALTGLIPKYMAGKPLLPHEFSFPLLTILTVAPVFEEFLLRGAVLPSLMKGFSFLQANILSSAMFLFLHVPGWFFMGNLGENLTRPFGGACSIFLLGLIFGYVAHRGRSVMGSMLAHFFNNLAS